MLRFPKTLFLIFGPLVSSGASACSCGELDLEKAWQEAKHVFVAEIGPVLRAGETPGSILRAQFQPVEILKGEPDQIAHLTGSVDDGGASCRLAFEEGERYLIVAKDEAVVSTCDGSVSLEPELPYDAFHVDLVLEFFRAASFDETSDCTFSRSAQVEKMISLAYPESESTHWRISNVYAPDHQLTYTNSTGQRLTVRYGGCQDLGSILELQGIVPDLTEGQVAGVVLALAETFWGPYVFQQLSDQLTPENASIEQTANGVLMAIDHKGYAFEVRYLASESRLSASYIRDF